MQQAIGNEINKGTSKIGVTSWGAVQGTCSKTSGFTHGDNFVVTGTKGRPVGAQEATGERVSNQSKHHRGRFDKEYESAESENMLGRD